jgi:rfaE bifunctional protein nucleotidyltransferase chain/domain
MPRPPIYQDPRIVFTNGCFDRLHPGHEHLLSQCVQIPEADFLVIGLNTDSSIRKLKGPYRPLEPFHTRWQNVTAYLNTFAPRRIPHTIVPMDDDPLTLILAVQPHWLVKGGDYTEATTRGAGAVLGWGGKVIIVPRLEGYSTTNCVLSVEAGA